MPPSALRRIGVIRPLYAIPRDDLAAEVLVPAMAASESVQCMAGFFSSAAFRYLAAGLASFINGSTGEIRLVISPALSEEDMLALRDAVERPEEVLTRAAVKLLAEARISVSALERHAVQCLSYLVVSERLKVRFAIMKAGGMFHPKVWIFRSQDDSLVAHGSSNPTAAGLGWNFEVVTIEKSWTNEEGKVRADHFGALFERIWQGADTTAWILDLPAVLSILRRSGTAAPTMEEFWQAWRADAEAGLVPAPSTPNRNASTAPLPGRLAIPAGLQWESGPFAHQARAVKAWEEAGGRGLLSMATGSGKTVSALICASRLQSAASPLLVVVAAPFRPLVEQWCDEVTDFGVFPIKTQAVGGRARDALVAEAIERLARRVSEVEVLVVTHDYLVSNAFYNLLQSVPATLNTLLIADEVHNLGRPGFVKRPLERFNFRLGLSATPILQYNQIGTEAIARFFGETVFEFGLDDAIGLCLVPYNYYLHPVALHPNELAEWDELTARLIRLGFAAADQGEASGPVDADALALLVKRRAVLEAAAAKVDLLVELLRQQGLDSLRHTLVYCTDKRPEQLRDVNKRLLAAGAFVRQLTEEETSSRPTTKQILDDFAVGHYQILTCKRVLDEGVDIPQVTHAYLLASSTVRRQWIQRRGRVLRRCESIGKRIAHLHDFLVIPPESSSSSGKAILRQEFERARAFAELSANAGSLDGPFALMASVTDGVK